jgi:hypothetical protein
MKIQKREASVRSFSVFIVKTVRPALVTTEITLSSRKMDCLHELQPNKHSNEYTGICKLLPTKFRCPRNPSGRAACEGKSASSRRS